MESSSEAKPAGRIYVNPKFLASRASTYQPAPVLPPTVQIQYQPSGGVLSHCYVPPHGVTYGCWQQTQQMYYPAVCGPQVAPESFHQNLFGLPPPPPPPLPPSCDPASSSIPFHAFKPDSPEVHEGFTSNTVIFREDVQSFQGNPQSLLGEYRPPASGMPDRQLVSVKRPRRKKRKKKSTSQPPTQSFLQPVAQSYLKPADQCHPGTSFQTSAEQSAHLSQPSSSKRVVLLVENSTGSEEKPAPVQVAKTTALSVSRYRLVRNSALTDLDKGAVQSASQTSLKAASSLSMTRKRRKSFCAVNRFKLVRNHPTAVQEVSKDKVSSTNQLSVSDSKACWKQNELASNSNHLSNRFKLVRKPVEKVVDAKPDTEVKNIVSASEVRKRRRTSSSGSGKLMSKYRIVKMKHSPKSNSELASKIDAASERGGFVTSQHKLVRTPIASRRVVSKGSRTPALISKYKFVKQKLLAEVSPRAAIPSEESKAVTASMLQSAKKKGKVSKYKLVRSGSVSESGQPFRASKYKLIRGASTLSAFKRDFLHRTGKYSSAKSPVGTKVVRCGAQSFKVSRTRLRRISASSGAAQMLKRGEAEVVQKGDSLYAVTARRLKRMSSNEVEHLPVTQRNRMSIIARARNRSLATLSSLRKKSTLPCIFLAKFGKCTRKESGRCPYDHSSRREAKKVMPTCQFFLEGRCHRGDECPYPHVKHSSKTPICLSFISGKCLLGDKCNRRHENICLEFKSTGQCKQGHNCPLKHIKVVKRNRNTRKINKRLEENKMAPQVRYFEQSEQKTEPAGTAVLDELASKRARLLRRIQDMKNAIAQVSSNEVVSESGRVTESTRPPVGNLPDYIAID